MTGTNIYNFSRHKFSLDLRVFLFPNTKVVSTREENVTPRLILHLMIFVLIYWDYFAIVVH